MKSKLKNLIDFQRKTLQIYKPFSAKFCKNFTFKTFYLKKLTSDPQVSFRQLHILGTFLNKLHWIYNKFNIQKDFIANQIVPIEK